MTILKRILAHFKAKNEVMNHLYEYERAERRAIRWHKSVKHIRKHRQDWMTALLKGCA